MWDNDERQVGRVYSDGTRVTSGFDQVGVIGGSADATGRTTSTWDNLNRLRTACYASRKDADGAVPTPPGCVECWWSQRLVGFLIFGTMPCVVAR